MANKPKSAKTKTVLKKVNRAKEPLPTEAPSTRRLNLSAPNWLDRKTFIIILLLAGILGYGGWSYMNQKSLVDSLKDPSKSEEVIRDELVKEVKKIAVIPEDEKPIIIEVKNLSALQGQPFYTLAEEGDRVLLYAEAKRAILYRPSTDQVVNISNNIVLENSSQPQTETSEPTLNQPE